MLAKVVLGWGEAARDNAPVPVRTLALLEPVTDIPNTYSLSISPRLGVLTLATAARRAGLGVEVYNDQIRKPRLGDLLRADMIGISILTNTAERGYAYADMIRGKRPVVFGGFHPTFLPEEALDHGDFAVRGEGEETLLELVDALNGGRPLSSVRGLSYRADGEVRHNPDRPVAEQYLDHSPDYAAVSGLARSLRRPLRGYPLRLLFLPATHTSRGCPRNCRYCTVIGMAGRVPRYRDIDLAVDELRNATQMARRAIVIADDNLTANLPRAKEFLRRIIAASIPPQWRLTAQLEMSAFRDDELLALLREANFELLHVGYESVNRETLRNWRKPITQDMLFEPATQARKHGLRINGMFVLGSDCDTRGTVRDTVDFAIESELATMQMWILTPLPGSDVYRETRDENRIFNARWAHYDCQHSTFFPRRIRPSTLQREVRAAYRRFYTLRRMTTGPGNRLTYGLNAYRMDGWMKRYAKKLERIEAAYYDGELLRPERLSSHVLARTTRVLS